MKTTTRSMAAPPNAAPSIPTALPWVRFSLWGVSVFVAAGGFYLLSLGPVSRFYQSHPPKLKPGVVMIGSVTYPRWVVVVYRPAFWLLGSGKGQSGLGGSYRSYRKWWVDRRADCMRNLRQLDEAKRKWAADTQRTNGAMPYAAHIVDYLPKGSEAKCPTGRVSFPSRRREAGVFTSRR